MAQRVQVMCINKSNRTSHFERIKFIGGVNADGTRWRLSIDDAISGIESGRWDFFVSVDRRNQVEVEVSDHLGHKYLRTRADTLLTDNLLSLPECPP